MKRLMSIWLVTLLALQAASARAEAPPASTTITVQVEGFQNKEGVALIALYASEASWLDIPKAAQLVRAKITGKTVTVTFKDVKPGTYAVAAVHDENKNNKLDMRWLPYPKPKEGAGASQGATGKAGPPKWEDAKFNVAAKPVSVSITLSYP